MRRKDSRRINATLYAIVIEELVSGASTRAELSEQSGLSAHSIQAIVTALKKRHLIYVAGWEQDALGRHTIAAFAFGDKRDAPRPKPLTATQCKQAWRERKRLTAALMRPTETPHPGVKVCI